jgi:surfeit locus 1 family protein
MADETPSARPSPLRRWLPLAAVWLLVPVFVLLGIWQLQRADEKRRLQEEYDARGNGPVVRVEPRMQAGEDLRFYRVEATGRYEPEHQFLLDNRVYHGRAGYHVITPLKIGDSELRVLVNRGWIALGESRDKLPSIDTPREPVTVTGVATVPSEKGFRPTAALMWPGHWETVWPYLDMKRYAQTVPYPVQPVVILLDPEHPTGFTREWSRLDAGIAVHQGYAFQWFALAVALVGLTLLLRRRARGAGRSTGLPT